MHEPIRKCFASTFPKFLAIFGVPFLTNITRILAAEGTVKSDQKLQKFPQQSFVDGFMKIWQRYMYKETCKTLFLILGTVYFLFVIIDYSLRAKVFHTVAIPFSELLYYYGCQFSRRAPLLIPFALMISGIRLLTTLNLHNELIALLASGLRLKQLMRPLLIVAGICALFLYLNYAFVYPHAMKGANQFENQYVYRNAKSTGTAVNVIVLKDHSKLVYHSYDQHTFSDVYWLKSPKELYHIQTLNAPIGKGVDHIRDGERIASYDQMTFNDLDVVAATLVPTDQLSFKELFKQLPKRLKLSDRDAGIATHFNAKLALPWLCFLVILAPAPWCLRFSRQVPIFFIYALSITGFLVFLTSMDAVMILGEAHVFSPYWIVWAPLVFGLLFTNLIKISGISKT